MTVPCTTFHQPLGELEAEPTQPANKHVTLVWVTDSLRDCQQRQ